MKCGIFRLSKTENVYPEKMKAHQKHIHKYAIQMIFQLKLVKVYFFPEITDVFAITSIRRTFFFPETENLVTEDCLEIEDVLKFESLEPCMGKKAAFG